MAHGYAVVTGVKQILKKLNTVNGKTGICKKHVPHKIKVTTESGIIWYIYTSILNHLLHPK